MIHREFSLGVFYVCSFFRISFLSLAYFHLMCFFRQLSQVSPFCVYIFSRFSLHFSFVWRVNVTGLAIAEHVITI